MIRLVVGVSFMGPGSQKLFGWFGGHGPKETGAMMESIGCITVAIATEAVM